MRLTVPRSGRTPATIELERGDITLLPVDAIVNAANSALAGGGGVDGAIHRAAGPGLMAELRSRYRGCPAGSAVITASGRLAEHGVGWVVHAVGPIWQDGRSGEEGLLRSAYQTALHLADEAGARSIAFPAISCGVYGYPLDPAARVALRSVGDGLASARTVEGAVFVLLDGRAFEAFRQVMADLSGGTRATPARRTPPRP